MSHTQPLYGTLNGNNSSTKPCLFLGKWGKGFISIVAEHPYPQWSDRRRSLELTSSIQPVAGQTDCCQLPRPTLLWNRQKGGWSKPEDLKQKTHTNQTSVYIYILHTWLYLLVISVISLYIFLTVPSCFCPVVEDSCNAARNSSYSISPETLAPS